ncbi:PREDICTED: two-component response regulator-like APRR9 isoform X2 [Tarenaya hassleriana]|uniref:two-component response regulator-like APRR9 isoform X2 n=1 Tax=Tarenaya hassleriana TaxID=28532 RepID=UPI00053C7A2E|nr:PREDICTED: two-component response regulator-like APRR9 isoform X2 [Tarenaya hassleriana]
MNHLDACNFAPTKFKHRIPVLDFSALSYIKVLASIVVQLVFCFLLSSKACELFITVLLFVFCLFALIMNIEEDLSGKTLKSTGRSPEDICVLLVDSDPSCLMVISNMLQESGYRVVTADRASDALHILRDREGEIDLIMTEAHLSDMDKYELLETITGISKLPIVVMGTDGQVNSALGCMFKGAKHYLVKPFVMGDLKHLWQITISSRRGVLNQLDAGRTKQNGSGNDSQPPLHAEDHMTDNKRNELAEAEEHKEVNDDNCQKKPKLICADELQNRSVQYVCGLGTEDEVNQGKKRKERSGTEIPREGDNYVLRNQKILKSSCVDEIQNRSPDAIHILGIDETQIPLHANELNLDYNKKKRQVEMDTYEENGGNPELGIQKLPKLVYADELGNRSPQNVGDLGPNGAHLDENFPHVNITGLTAANILPHVQELGMSVTTMYQIGSFAHDGGIVPESMENTNPMMKSSIGGIAPPLSPAESSSNDHMWAQMRQCKRKCGGTANTVEKNPRQNAEENTAAAAAANVVGGGEAVVNGGEINVSDISELFLGNVLELADLLNNDDDYLAPLEYEQQQLLQLQQDILQEEQGSSPDVPRKSPEDFFSDSLFGF